MGLVPSLWNTAERSFQTFLVCVGKRCQAESPGQFLSRHVCVSGTCEVPLWRVSVPEHQDRFRRSYFQQIIDFQWELSTQNWIDHNPWFTYSFFFLSSLKDIFHCLQRERKRASDRPWLVASGRHPNWGSNRQPRCVPRPVYGQCSNPLNHPARAIILDLKHAVIISPMGTLHDYK